VLLTFTRCDAAGSGCELDQWSLLPSVSSHCRPTAADRLREERPLSGQSGRPRSRRSRTPAGQDSWRHCYGKGPGLQPQPLGGPYAVPRWPSAADRQQSRRTADPTLGHGSEELALRGYVVGWEASGHDHELDTVS